MNWKVARAPASIGNWIVGFDILGMSFPVAFDVVRVRRIDSGVKISRCNRPLPMEPQSNTAAVALQAMIDEFELDFGFEIEIEKGIPMSAGMGGSAASAVAATLAGNQWLDRPLTTEQLIMIAGRGEVVASGSSHLDNVAPSLLGGLVLCVGTVVRSISVKPGLYCVLVHPDCEIDTRDARRVLASQITSDRAIRQMGNLAGTLACLQTGDFDGLRHYLRDEWIEPQRMNLLPGFSEAQSAAMAAGALGCSFSGAGPSMIAICSEKVVAGQAQEAMLEVFKKRQLSAESWVHVVSSEGAGVLL